MIAARSHVHRIPARRAVRLALGLVVVTAALEFPLPAHAARALPTISFSGYSWTVKASSGQVGPGPNEFSSSKNNVWVDRNGYLHLRINFSKGKWYCAEIASQRSLGYGTYRFTLGSAVSNLDPNVVLGLFTWDDDPAYNDREIDLEFSRWGNAADPTNGQYVVQPWSGTGNLQRTTVGANVPSNQSFSWSPGQVAFASSNGSTASWLYTGIDVPPPGNEKTHLNLWLYRGRPPSNGRAAEVVIRSFSFVPAL
ncbi:MAG: glycoside hydrolase family 16 protein [Actinobacteria bacterium]|nr:glycoside hydrolase family 16 protein [Actinomycetota bacterium]